jgi:hypothetical protein
MPGKSFFEEKEEEEEEEEERNDIGRKSIPTIHHLTKTKFYSGVSFVPGLTFRVSPPPPPPPRPMVAAGCMLAITPERETRGGEDRRRKGGTEGERVGIEVCLWFGVQGSGFRVYGLGL